MSLSPYQSWIANREFQIEHYARHIIVFEDNSQEEYWFILGGNKHSFSNLTNLECWMDTYNYTYNIVEINE